MSVCRQDFEKYFVPVYNPAAFVPSHAKGARLWDTKGREYVDFAGGIAVSALGHCHPAMMEALRNQADKLWHLSNAYTNEQVLLLAKKLVEKTFADKVFFANSGAEANEAALKLARKAGSMVNANKTQIISFNKSFHGRTLFTVSVGGQSKYSAVFAPLPEGINYATYNDIESVKAIISDKTCAVIVEPIQGEGGIITADSEFLQGLRQLCDEYDAALIFDEVQTGVGRTGHLYAYMESGVVPDMLTTAKALGGGFPIGAMLCNDKFAQKFVVGDHGTTYGGNPLACAVANAVLDTIDDKELLAGVQERYQYFVKKLNELNATYELFDEIRGRGLLLGCALKADYAGRSKEIVTLAAKHGLMCLVAGVDVVRFTPSLVIEFADIDEGLTRFEKALAEFKG